MRAFVRTFFLTIAMLLTGGAIAAQELVPVQNEKGKWGYVDADGKKVINYSYESAGVFIDGMALVRKGDKWGYIDPAGREVIKIKYTEMGAWTGNYCKVGIGGKVEDGAVYGAKYGYIDKTGVEIIKPDYEEIGQFKNGVAFIRKGKKYGYINDKMQMIIPCKYNAVGAFNDLGYVWVCDGAKFGNDNSFSGGKYGIYYIDGKEIITPKYADAGVFIPYIYSPTEKDMEKMTYNHKTVLKESGSHHLIRKSTIPKTLFSKLREDASGFYASNQSDGYKNGVYDLQGNMIVAEGKYMTPFYPTDGYVLIYFGLNSYNFLNLATGNMLFKDNVKNAWAFNDGVAVISRDGKYWELIDTQGRTLTKAYYTIFPLKDGIHIVRDEQSNGDLHYGAIDGQGNVVIPAENFFVYPPSNGLMSFRKVGSDIAGYYNTKGEVAIEPRFRSALSFKGDIAEVKTDGGWGLIDKTGREVVKCRWTSTSSYNTEYEPFIFVSDDTADKKGFMLLSIEKDELLSTNKYYWFRSMGRDYKGVALVGSDDEHIGIISNEGKQVVPLLFTADEARTAYEMLLDSGKDVWEEFDTYRIKLYNNPERNDGRLTDIIKSSMWDY